MFPKVDGFTLRSSGAGTGSREQMDGEQKSGETAPRQDLYGGVIPQIALGGLQLPGCVRMSRVMLRKGDRTWSNPRTSHPTTFFPITSTLPRAASSCHLRFPVAVAETSMKLPISLPPLSHLGAISERFSSRIKSLIVGDKPFVLHLTCKRVTTVLKGWGAQVRVTTNDLKDIIIFSSLERHNLLRDFPGELWEDGIKAAAGLSAIILKKDLMSESFRCFFVSPCGYLEGGMEG